MRIIFLMAILLPSMASAANWVEVGQSPEARFLMDKDSVETVGGDAKAWVKFIYRHEQPGQNLTQGKPFDSSLNQYYMACSARKYQVLQLIMLYKNDTVGTFRTSLNQNDFDTAEPGSPVMLLLTRICAAGKPEAATHKN
jgi:hypothetical protein